jgi:hypothetical protein
MRVGRYRAAGVAAAVAADGSGVSFSTHTDILLFRFVS